jgi:hypothetical protein
LKRITLGLDDALFARVRQASAGDGQSLEKWICLSLQQSLRQRHMLRMKEKMMRGYRQMAALSRQFAELGLAMDVAALTAYEASLAEREHNDPTW